MGACVTMRLKKPLRPTALQATYTWSPVEAECVVDDQVFTGISEPHIPEPRKKKEGW